VSTMLAWSLTTFSAIFFVVDPLAVVPIFLAMTPGDNEGHRASMARRASLIAGAVLVAFAFGGTALFHLFGVSLPAFKVAGGVLLLLTALDQLRSHEPETRTSGGEIAEGRAKDDIAVVPLALPLLAGPGSIATVIVLAADARETWQSVVLTASILCTAGLSWAVLGVAGRIDGALGATGKAVFLRVSGLLLAAVGVQFVLTGVGEAFPALLAR
jgi:multiple antibiotic resistance protein